ncbi:MAG TPA: RCC1 domain-containing protein [Chloroflexota bacterium]|nr:RCC1 domain-containing protein [Chloroflexota bacterium]
MRRDGTIECWSQSSSGRPDVKTVHRYPGRFSRVSAGGVGLCGLRANGSLKCWGTGVEAPPDRFKQVSLGNGFACGVLTSRRATCWGRDNHGQSRPPQDLRFRHVSAGIDDACGATISEKVVCWGDRSNPGTRPHRGRFLEVELMPSLSRAAR